MNHPLHKKDYVKILQYYNISIPKSKKTLQHKAEEIINNKLCRCIKKVDPVNEAKSIGICTKTIINNKGFTRGKFSCKKPSYITIQRKKRSNTKTRKNKANVKK